MEDPIANLNPPLSVLARELAALFETRETLTIKQALDPGSVDDASVSAIALGESVDQFALRMYLETQIHFLDVVALCFPAEQAPVPAIGANHYRQLLQQDAASVARSSSSPAMRPRTAIISRTSNSDRRSRAFIGC